MEKKIIVGVIAVLLVVIGIVANQPLVVNVPPAEVQIIESNGDNYGAMPGDTLPGPMFSVAGVEKYYHSRKFNNLSTSTLCSFKSPNATTSLELAYASIKGNSGGTILHIARGATNWATTTELATFTATAGSAMDLKATTTDDTLAATYGFVAPNSWINIQLEAMTYATGTCSAIFVK